MRIRRAIGVALRWLALTLAGWLVYVWLRALWALIDLGAPFYDWQWYLPVLVVLVAMMAKAVLLQALSGPVLTVVFAVSITWLIAGFAGFGQVTIVSLQGAPPVPISFWAYADFRNLPDAVLRDLRAAGGRIYLATGEIRDFDGLAESLRRAGDFGIEVYLVPHASNFLSAPVHQEWIANAREAVAFIEREKLTSVRGLIGDVEPPAGYPLDLNAHGGTAFAEAIIHFREFLQDVDRDHREIQVGITALWPHFIDTLDGDADLSMILRSPADPPGGWDFVNLMTYSSYLPPEQRAYAIYLLERAMMRLYPGGQASHLIGLVGEGMPGEPLLGFDDLVRDARLSRGLGVREIAVYQLDGALRVFGDDFAGRLTRAVNGASVEGAIEVPFSRPVSLATFALAAADAFLDVRGQWGWLWVVWAIVGGIIALNGRVFHHFLCRPG